MSEEDLKAVPFSIGHDESSLKLIEIKTIKKNKKIQ